MGLLSSYNDHSVKITHPEETKHIHQRAPTDESIRLAKEWEEKIHGQITHTLLVEDNSLKYTCCISEDNMGFSHVHLKMKVNERIFKSSFPVNYSTPDHVIENIKDFIMKSLTKEVLVGLVSNFIQYPKSKYIHFSNVVKEQLSKEFCDATNT